MKAVNETKIFLPQDSTPGKQKKNFSSDFLAATISALVGIPESVAFGTLALAPLGAAFLPLGVLAGLITQIALTVPAIFIRGNRLMQVGPYSLAALLLANSIDSLHHSFGVNGVNLTYAIILMVALAGLVQIAFALLRIGQSAKYIPYPIISGLLNGTALLIILTQLQKICNLPNMHWQAIISKINYFAADSIPFPKIGLVIFTLIILILSERFIKKMPAALLGILLGSLFYAALHHLLPQADLGKTIGSIDFNTFNFAPLTNNNLLLSFWNSLDLQIFPFLLVTAISLAILTSLQTLLAQVNTDNLTQERSSANRELFSIGLGNIFTGILGGIPGAGHIGRSVIVHHNGGFSKWNRPLTGMVTLFILVTTGFLFPYISDIVLSALLLKIAFHIFDSWIFKKIRSLASGHKEDRIHFLLIDIAVSLLVTFMMVAADVISALVAGLLAAVALFILQMRKKIIRRQFNGNKLRSNVERPEEELYLLRRHGHLIKILHLEGSLFFGTADTLFQSIASMDFDKTNFIILDFRNIHQIDSTGIHIVSQINSFTKARNCQLIFCEFERLHWDISTNSNFQYWPHLSDALAWCEDRILDQHLHSNANIEIPFDALELFRDLKTDEKQKLQTFVSRKIFKAGSTIFRKGQSDETLYIIAKGKARVYIGRKETSSMNTISVIYPGTIFGEMALIDAKPRSASVMCKTDLVCYALSRKNLEKIQQNSPEIAFKIYAVIARELSKRQRTLLSSMNHWQK